MVVMVMLMMMMMVMMMMMMMVMVMMASGEDDGVDDGDGYDDDDEDDDAIGMQPSSSSPRFQIASVSGLSAGQSQSQRVMHRSWVKPNMMHKGCFLFIGSIFGIDSYILYHFGPHHLERLWGPVPSGTSANPSCQQLKCSQPETTFET